jgi:hypothetical protein
MQVEPLQSSAGAPLLFLAPDFDAVLFQLPAHDGKIAGSGGVFLIHSSAWVVEST